MHAPVAALAAAAGVIRRELLALFDALPAEALKVNHFWGSKERQVGDESGVFLSRWAGGLMGSQGGHFVAAAGLSSMHKIIAAHTRAQAHNMRHL